MYQFTDIAMQSQIQKTGITLSAMEEEILILLVGEQAYGWQIMEAIATLSDGVRSSMPGTFYPLFKRLEDKQYIRSRWSEDLSCARRKYYSITRTGIEALKQKEEYRRRLAQWLPPQE